MMVLISAPNFSFMRRTIGSCSARPRPTPLGRAAEAGVWGVPPGKTFNRSGLPKAPLAAAVTTRLASDPKDISITVGEAATLINNSLPSIFHSPASNIEATMRWPASETALSTASRAATASTKGLSDLSHDGLETVSGDSGSISPLGSVMMVEAGAVAAIITAGAGDAAETRRGPDAALSSAPYSAFGVPFRAESAAKGDT